MIKKVCIDCGSKDVIERRRCKECVKKYNSDKSKKYYKEKGKKRRKQKLPKAICPICNKEMIMWRRDQMSHLSCRPKVVNDYNKVPRSKKGTMLVKELLLEHGITIPKGYVIHHLDENPWNNNPTNLWILSRGLHNSLHRKLQYQRSLWLKDHNNKDENCWGIIRNHITTTCLETNGVNIIKVSDIW